MKAEQLQLFRVHPQLGIVTKRLISNIDTSGGLKGCWPWILSTDEDGYGKFYLKRRGRSYGFSAHRLVLEFVLGRLLEPGEEARHLCHNPGCCNPQHLAPGSRSANRLDSVRDGRIGKITPEDRIAIAIERSKGTKLRALAAGYGVSRATICKALKPPHHQVHKPRQPNWDFWIRKVDAVADGQSADLVFYAHPRFDGLEWYGASRAVAVAAGVR